MNKPNLELLAFEKSIAIMGGGFAKYSADKIPETIRNSANKWWKNRNKKGLAILGNVQIGKSFAMFGLVYKMILTSMKQQQQNPNKIRPYFNIEYYTMQRLMNKLFNAPTNWFDLEHEFFNFSHIVIDDLNTTGNDGINNTELKKFSDYIVEIINRGKILMITSNSTDNEIELACNKNVNWSRIFGRIKNNCLVIRV